MDSVSFYGRLVDQVSYIDELVFLIQQDAERSVGQLRPRAGIGNYSLTVILAIIVCCIGCACGFEIPLIKLHSKQRGRENWSW